MVINLTTLQGKLAKTEVEFMGQTCKVMYDPLRITSEWVTRTQSGTEDEFIVAFGEVVRSWDVQRSGKKVPITKAGLQGIPLSLLKAIYSQVVFGEVEAEVEEQGKA